LERLQIQPDRGINPVCHYEHQFRTRPKLGRSLLLLIAFFEQIRSRRHHAWLGVRDYRTENLGFSRSPLSQIGPPPTLR
jgi:hypothetical protein